eukprot:sb/3461520/
MISGLGKKIIPMRGEIELKITIGHTTRLESFIVSDHIDNEFLLGMDVIGSFNMCINILKRSVVVSGESHSFKAKPCSLPNQVKIKVYRSVIIPANSAKFVNGVFPLSHKSAATNYEGVIEPYHNLSSKVNLLVTGTLSYSDSNKIPVHVVNPIHFYKMKDEIKLYVAACVTCQRSKATNRPLKAPLKPQVYHHFNQCIQIDHLEPSKQRTPRGHVALLTIVDMYSGYLVCIPVRSTSANHTIQVIMKHWIARFGVPLQISHDQGSGFESRLFTDICKVFGIRNVRSTPWKSSTQGRVESSHRRINACFRAILDNTGFQKYDLYIDWIVFTLNCLRSNRTGFSANFLVFGREAQTPRDFFVPETKDTGEASSLEKDAYGLYSHIKDTARTVYSRRAMASAPVLGVPDLENDDATFLVTLDASKNGLGAVLSQINPVTKERRIISYYSKKVPKHLKNWGATRLEFLALHSALLHWRLYLQSNHFKIFSDCKALLNLDTIFSKDNAYMQRRLADLSGFRFTIEHVSGRSEEIQIADYLSRYAFGVPEKSVHTQTESSFFPVSLPVPPKDPNPVMVTTDFSDTDSVYNDDLVDQHSLVDNINTIFRVSNTVSSDQDLGTPVTSDDIREGYQDDLILSEVIDWVLQDRKPDLDPSQCHKETWYFYRNFELLRVRNGILQIKKFDRNNLKDSCYITVVPYTLIFAHQNNTYDQLSKHFHFYKMKDEIKLYVAACVTCQRSKATNRPLKAPLKPQVYHHFNQCIQIDHLEPSKQRTPRGHVALLTIVDMYSGYLVCIPVRSTSANHTIQVIMKHWIARFGVPLQISHDQGSGFESRLFKDICKVFGIRNVRSTPWKSSTQGRVESSHRRINACFRAILDNTGFQKYDLYIDWIVFTLNCLRSNRTGFSANFLVFGREAQTPRDFFVPETKDTGSGFESRLFTDICKVFGIRNVRSTPWKSSTQGRVESSHRRINACFRAILDNTGFQKYDLYIDWIVFTLNCLRSNRTGFSANFLVFGREAQTPRDFFVPETKDTGEASSLEKDA